MAKQMDPKGGMISSLLDRKWGSIEDEKAENKLYYFDLQNPSKIQHNFIILFFYFAFVYIKGMYVNRETFICIK